MKSVEKEEKRKIQKTNRSIEIKAKPLETFLEKPIKKINWDSEVEEFGKSFKRKKFIVEKVLRNSNAATNNDTILYLQCLENEFSDIDIEENSESIKITIPKGRIRFLTSPESYTRARRKLNEEGIGMPTNPEVIKKRSKREKAIREYFRTK